jgi:SAM-dependent methyltransferase
MSSESISFSKRAHLTELMDEPCSYEEFRACMADLESVNRTVLAYRPTVLWLTQFLPTADTLHILDVGAGSGGMLRRIETWANDNYVNVRLTGLDVNPKAAKVARDFTLPSSRIHWVTGDVFSYQPVSPVDMVISSIFTHHLTDAEIVQFLQWMERTAVRGWFINDLARGPKSYRIFKWLAKFMGWHRIVQHDGPVSILRSFTADDWQDYIREAGLESLPITIAPAWPGRLCVSRVKR